MNSILNKFKKFKNKNSKFDARELSYSESLFNVLCPDVCSFYVKNCMDDWEFVGFCKSKICVIFLGLKYDTCSYDAEADGHRNILFIYHDTKKYFWFDPEGSHKRKKNIKPLLEKLDCQHYEEIKCEYGPIQIEPEEDSGYCAVWCYLTAFLSVKLDKRGEEMLDFLPDIAGKMDVMKGFATYFKNKLIQV